MYRIYNAWFFSLDHATEVDIETILSMQVFIYEQRLCCGILRSGISRNNFQIQGKIAATVLRLNKLLRFMNQIPYASVEL